MWVCCLVNMDVKFFVNVKFFVKWYYIFLNEMIVKKVEFVIVVYRFLMLFGFDDINFI